MDDRAAHVGFYLVDKGQSQLEQAVDMRLSFFQRIRRWSGRGAVQVYLGSIVLLTVMFTGGFLALASTEGWDGWSLALLGLLSAIAVQSIGGDLGELARDGARDTAPTPANGFYRRSPS